jgi:hypothetical protein
MLGSFDHATRRLIVHTSPTKRSRDFVTHLEQLDRLYGPRPGHPIKPVVLVEYNGPIHTSKLSLAARVCFESGNRGNANAPITVRYPLPFLRH